MTSSIFSSSPLVNDMKRHRRVLLRLAGKALLFVGLLFVADRAADAVLCDGLLKYYGLNRESAVACVGNSRTVLGINGDLLEEQLQVPVAKYAVQGAKGRDRLAMVRHLFTRQGDAVKAVVLDVGGCTFNDAGLSSNSYRLFFPFMDEASMAEYIGASCPSVGQRLLRRAVKSSRYEEATISLAARGHLGVRSNLKWAKLDLAALEHRIQRGRIQEMRFQDDAYEIFDETVRCVRSNGAKAILVYIPRVDVLNNVDRKAHDRIVTLLEDYAESHAGVFFLDYNSQYESKHQLFTDGLHLNAAGQREVTLRLAEDLQKIMGSDLNS